MAAVLGRELPVTHLMTVRARTREGAMVSRGLFAGDGYDGFAAGAGVQRRDRGGAAPQGGGVPPPGRVPLDLARQQRHLPVPHGARGRRRARRPRPGGHALRRGRRDRSAEPPPRLPRHGGDPRRGGRGSGASRLSLGGGAPDPRLLGGSLPDHLRARRPLPRGDHRRRLRVPGARGRAPSLRPRPAGARAQLDGGRRGDLLPAESRVGLWSTRERLAGG